MRYHKCSLHGIDVERMFEKLGESLYVLESEKKKIAYQITIIVTLFRKCIYLQHNVVNILTHLT